VWVCATRHQAALTQVSFGEARVCAHMIEGRLVRFGVFCRRIAAGRAAAAPLEKYRPEPSAECGREAVSRFCPLDRMPHWILPKTLCAVGPAGLDWEEPGPVFPKILRQRCSTELGLKAYSGLFCST
jgi:hypothetical protein